MGHNCRRKPLLTEPSHARRTAQALMALLFCATTPLGCFIGVGVSESYEADSVRSKWIRGACNGLTGAREHPPQVSCSTVPVCFLVLSTHQRAHFALFELM